MRKPYWVSLALIAAPLVLVHACGNDDTTPAPTTSGGGAGGTIDTPTPTTSSGGAGTTTTGGGGGSTGGGGDGSSSSDAAKSDAPASEGGGDSPAPAQMHWVASWGAGAVPMAPQPNDNMPPNGLTYRNITRMSLGGSQVRLTISNLNGTDPLRIDDVTVAISNGADSIQANTLRPVTFTVNGRAVSAITIPAGETSFSDPVDIIFGLEADLAVSIHVPQQTITTYTDHPLGHGLNYLANGDQAGLTSLTNPTPFEPWHFLSAIDVMAPQDAAAIVAFGDSITDGAADDPRGSNERWPNYFADQLYQHNYTNLAVVNEGIGSDRVLTDGTPNDRSGATPSALTRWGYDALQRAGVKYIILLEGVNDIDAATSPRGPVISAADLINGYKTLVNRAHAAGVKVIIGTLTPFGDSANWSTTGQQIHDDVNAWIRAGTANGFDGFVDFEEATRDPANPLKYRTGFDGGDGLHPSHEGKQAMANEIRLTLFD